MMKKLNELINEYPLLFKDSGFRFQCEDGWYDILSTLLGLIQHTLSRYREVVEIKNKFLEKKETVPDWIEEYFQSNTQDPLQSFKIFQIKEKFGSLRFYFECDVNNSEVNGAVSFAECHSSKVCEECGKPGFRGTREGNKYWIKTLCQDHRAKSEQGALASDSVE